MGKWTGILKRHGLMTAISLLLIAISLPLNTGNVKADAPTRSSYAPAGYTLALSDDFSGTQLDTTKWQYRTDYRGGSWNSQQLASNVSVSNGNLDVHGIPRSNPNDPSSENSGGGIISLQQFKYGYYETRAKLQPADGFHSAFWTYSEDTSTTGIPESEVDGFEYQSGASTYQIYQNIFQHDDGYYSITGSGSVTLSNDVTQDFHVYGFLWEPDQVIYYVDGVQTKTIHYSNSDYAEDFNNIYLTMIASNNTTQETDTLFDYVQYYAPPTLSNSGAITIDNGDSGFSQVGTWDNSYSIAGYKGSNYIYNTSSTDKAIYTPTITTAGNYDVYIWYEAIDRRPTVPVQVTYNGGTDVDSQNIDQAVNGTGWYYIGTYPMSAGTGNHLDIDAPSSGVAVADAVMFVPSNDIVMDTTDSHFGVITGNWYSSGSVTGYDGTATKYSNSTNAQAGWTPDLNGTYEIYMYRVPYSNGDTNTKVEVVSDDGIYDSYQNWQTESSSWVDLGTYNLSAGATDKVTISRNSYYARVNAIMFVPVS